MMFLTRQIRKSSGTPVIPFVTKAIIVLVGLLTMEKVSLARVVPCLMVVQPQGLMELMLLIQQEKYKYGHIK